MWQALQTVRCGGCTFGAHHVWLTPPIAVPPQRGTGDPDYFGLPPSAGGPVCTAWMETACAPAMQNVPLTLRWPYNSTWRTEALAMFLIARGPYAWVGQHWPCYLDDSWDPMFDTDVGEPTSPCTSPSPGVFARTYSRGSAVMNCSSFEAQLTFPPPPGVGRW